MKMLERAKNSNIEVVKYIKNIDNLSNMNDNSNDKRVKGIDYGRNFNFWTQN